MAPGMRKNPQRANSSESEFSIMEFARQFPDDETCLRFLWDTRFNLGDDEAHCQRCDEIRLFKRYVGKQQRQAWTCTACGFQVYPTAGTIFHKSSTSVVLWFHAMYLMTSTRCGISAKQLERELGVTYKTAWRMFTLIRNELMVQDDDLTLSGVVEMDETLVGGKPRQSDRAGWAKGTGTERRQAVQKWIGENKVSVFGMVERNRMVSMHDEPKPRVTQRGKIVAKVVPAIRVETTKPHMDHHVMSGTRIVTDDSKIYRGLKNEGWRHDTVNHSERVYVVGDIHTSTIEGFWSLVKNGIRGSHHAVSPKWLQGYLNEYVWRYNQRDGRAMFALLLLRAAQPR
jgi:transposase-like protein